ncbi:MAG: hypothetical protein LUH22_18175 [Bacteroides sp.]|nr:hypothetical protein [Bacteroides sp.]
MKNIRIPFIFLTVLLLTHSVYPITTDDKLNLLRSLYVQGITYNDKVPADSVIAWGKELLLAIDEKTNLKNIIH